MTTAVEASNGHVQIQLHDFAAQDRRLADVLGNEIDSLRELLDAELNSRDELAQLLERSKERERRITRAIAVLEGGINQHAVSSKPAAAKAKPKPKKSTLWDVSEATVERVRVGFLRYWTEQPTPEQPFTQTALATWMGEQGNGISGETIRRAMDRLREREIVRVCGTTRGGGKLYAPMPEALSGN
jgi:hypothetical protein